MLNDHFLVPSAYLLFAPANVPCLPDRRSGPRSRLFSARSETAVPANNTASGWPIFWNQPSPTPKEWIKQRTPFCTFQSFQVFSHLSLEWVSVYDNATTAWSTNVTENETVIHQAHQIDAQPFTDVNHQATEETPYFATPMPSTLFGLLRAASAN
ncbi:hypothetical protein WOLCODRAFT_164867 [Wolfiporia cocos MD-104 SS10]|uniref:Glutaminase A N-terminal domain-containing protein n=1 Tax=Wolfiporia cocos (strain MD-104) TaxID=742152 RepID=A0A2H3JQ03_WOLCO|nr:hypothetical protein WOLCODRAFT_164867 [Wolfiporia cocos MD-104 SS10]